MRRHLFEVSGWTCDGCVQATQRVLSKVEGIREVAGDLEARTVTLTYEGGAEVLDQARAAIARAGFEVVGERAEA